MTFTQTAGTETARQVDAGTGAQSFLPQRDLAVTGPLDATSIHALRHLVADAIYDRPTLVLLDVTGVTSVTPSGLVGILECLRLARSRGADLRMHATSLTVLDAQTAAELTHVVRVYTGREAAVEGGSLRSQPNSRVGKRRRSSRDRLQAVPADQGKLSAPHDGGIRAARLKLTTQIAKKKVAA